MLSYVKKQEKDYTFLYQVQAASGLSLQENLAAACMEFWFPILNFLQGDTRPKGSNVSYSTNISNK